jgi:hypothetical protein
VRRAFATIFGLIAAGSATAACGQASQAPAPDYINPDRPGIADGSYVVGSGRFQVETGIQLEWRDDRGERDFRLFVPTLLRLGVNDRLEFRVEGNTLTYERSSPGGAAPARDATGLAPTSIGLKYHILDPDGVRRPSVGVIARLFPPNGSGAFRSDRTSGDVRVAADWDFAPKWSLNPNVGVGAYEDDSGRSYVTALAAMTLNFNPSPTLNFFGDFGAQAPERKNGRASLIVDAGTAIIIGKNMQLDLSAGTGIAGSTPPKLFVSAGVSERF